ncbi:hypothetical protein EC957_012032 [Mortierella hygrophila]|uniref:Uncharacterized protein n=1 Tax=Mortierella hygrophila TaxID=979708 RepID=A0A9P6K815_9FUNG|nr:hypothetical protein EC957_012032 [Mortierella hygrophila]
MPLNPFVAAAAITAGTMALPFAVTLGATGLGLSAAAIVVMTAQTPNEEDNGELPLVVTPKTVSEEDNGELPLTVNAMGPPADD